MASGDDEAKQRVMALQNQLIGVCEGYINKPITEEVLQQLSKSLQDELAKVAADGYRDSLDVRVATWEDIYPGWWDRNWKMLRAGWYKMLGKRPPFEIPGSRVQVSITVMERVHIPCMRATILIGTKADDQSSYNRVITS